MSWKKVGVTVISKPVAHGSGLYFRIPKQVCEAYDLFTAEAIEVKIERARTMEETE